MKNVCFALFGGLFTYLFTIMGSSLVFFSKNDKSKTSGYTLSFAAGVMLSASYFSLLKPAFEYTNGNRLLSIPIFIGFILGGLFLYLINILLDRSKRFDDSKERSLMLFIAMLIHNIPEGLAVGAAFGLVSDKSSLYKAIALMVAIAIQNFPEGASISIPMFNDGKSIKKAFFFGHISGIVEPIFSVIGALLVFKINLFMPLLLSFAASAMIYVVLEELIPEAMKKQKNLSALIAILSFTFMMILDLI